MVGKLLKVPVAGVRLDRMMVIVIPLEVAEQLDLDLSTFVAEPRFDEDGDDDEEETSPSQTASTLERRPIWVGSTIPRDAPPSDDDDAPRVRPIIPLLPGRPLHFHAECPQQPVGAALDCAVQLPQNFVLHRKIPVGPYELAVMPTGRGRSAVRAVLQGLPQGKQIEIITPLAIGADTASRK